MNLLLAGGSGVLVLGACEAFLRLAAHRVLGAGEVIVSGQVIDKTDPLLGFSLIPGSTRVHARGGAYVVRDTINSMGLRDVEHPAEKPPGTKRILVLGDSFMYGSGVKVKDTMSRWLDALIPGVEVVNAGVHAYGLAHEYLYYKHRGRRYDPDLVLLAFFVNDLEPVEGFELTEDPEGLPVSYVRAGGEDPSAGDEEPARLRNVVSSWLRSRSLLYVLVRKRIDSLRWRPREGAAAVPGPPAAPYSAAFVAEPGGPEEEDWRRAYRILDDLSRLVSGDGGRLAVVLVPAPFQISPEGFDDWVSWVGLPRARLSRTNPQDRLLAWCRRTGTPCHDLLPAFEGKDRRRYFFPHDFHWTPEGHRLAADSVLGFLTERALLKLE